MIERRLLHAVLEEAGVRHGADDVERGGLDDAGAPGVRHHRHAPQIGELGDAHAFGDTAGAGDVGLDHVDPSGVHEMSKAPAGDVLFAAGDASLDRIGELAIAGGVVRPEGFFHPVGTYLLETPHLADGVVGVRPAETDIEHQVDVVACRLAGGANEVDVEVGVATERTPAELDGGETALDQLADDLRCLVRGVWHQGAGVGADGGAMGTAEEAVDRLPEGLALDVPEGDVDAADGVHGRSLAAVVDRAAVELVPETVDLQRILAQQEVPQAAGDGVRRRRLDDGLHHRRQRIDLADAR